MPRITEPYVVVDPDGDNIHGQWNQAHLQDTASWKAYQRLVRQITRDYYPGRYYEDGRRVRSKYHRDHLLSVRDGYEQRVPEEMIAHPVNCRRVLATRNLRKGRKSLITQEELTLMYDSFNGPKTGLSLTEARAQLARVRRHQHRGQSRRVWLIDSKRYAWHCTTCDSLFARQF